MVCLQDYGRLLPCLILYNFHEEKEIVKHNNIPLFMIKTLLVSWETKQIPEYVS